MRRLTILAIAALFTILAFSATKTAKADIELDITCGCGTPTPTPTATNTPQPTSTPNNSTPPNGQVGAPICTDAMPDDPTVTSIVRKGTTATITWTKSKNANHYLIFYGTTPGSHQYGVPDTGDVTSYTISALDPKAKYYFEVRGVNGCQPGSGGKGGGQVLGASTSVLAATDSNLILPRIALGIIAGGVTLYFFKRQSI